MTDPIAPSDLRTAAAAALLQMDAPKTRGQVQRVVLEVSIDGRTEMVSIAFRDGKIVWSTTNPDDPRHVTVALELLATGASPPAAAGHELAVEHTRVVRHEPAAALAPRVATARTVRHERVAAFDPAALATALDDLVLAVVRVGVGSASEAPAVAEALDRIVAVSPSPLPLGVERWIGRLRAGVAARDASTVGRLLEGGSRIVADLRREQPDTDGSHRLGSWLGRSDGHDVLAEPLTERTLVEVARETVGGRVRGSIERRYLLDLANAEVYREERGRGLPASVGPCPRILQVGLAELEQGARPRRIRLNQYSVSADLGPAVSRRIAAASVRSFRLLVDQYRSDVERFPGLSEPFALIAPTATGRDGGIVLQDAEGYPLPLARVESGACLRALEQLLGDRVPTWIAGRLVDARGALLLVPLSVGLIDGGSTRLMRLT